MNDVILSRRAIRNMNTLYPDATPEELASSDNICIICREDMVNTSKKLPCGHIFHTACLRSWFQRQQTCPTCRLNILRAPTVPTAQNDNIDQINNNNQANAANANTAAANANAQNNNNNNNNINNAGPFNARECYLINQFIFTVIPNIENELSRFFRTKPICEPIECTTKSECTVRNQSLISISSNAIPNYANESDSTPDANVCISATTNSSAKSGSTNRC